MATLDSIQAYLATHLPTLQSAQFYQELAIIGCCYLIAFTISRFAERIAKGDPNKTQTTSLFRSGFISLCKLLFPIIAIILLKFASTYLPSDAEKLSLTRIAYIIASLIFIYSLANLLIKNTTFKRAFVLIGVPILFFHLIDVLDDIIAVLDSMYIHAGNIRISAYGAVRVILFGSLLFWLGRLSNSTGKKIIRSQANLDSRTKEIFSKLFEIIIFFAVFILLLQIMGINLTALAVFGGAIGVGLGFGLQSIAANFISGIIILLDRSVALDDYIQLEDGRCGRVTEMSLRATTLETFDGKDIVVPNEKFISTSFINWTHKDKRQRYRVDFSVAYSTDVRKLVDIIKQVVSEHPQVITGDDIPIQDRPDCEIDSFGDSGINMFVEFWMEGIDDGENRVGGDLLLSIFEAIKEHGFEIPFPQREVRILGSNKLDNN